MYARPFISESALLQGSAVNHNVCKGREKKKKKKITEISRSVVWRPFKNVGRSQLFAIFRNANARSASSERKWNPKRQKIFNTEESGAF